MKLPNNIGKLITAFHKLIKASCWLEKQVNSSDDQETKNILNTS